jgi:hypothetical protein
MTFDDQITADLDVIFNTDEFAETITYNGATISAVEGEVTERNTGKPGFSTTVASIFIQASDVTRPKAGDTVTFRSQRYKVAPFPKSEGGAWFVELIQDTVQV